MDDALPDHLAQTVSDFSAGISGLETLLAPLRDTAVEDLAEQLPPLDAARLHITLAYASNALFYMYLKTQGVPTSDHPVKDELRRIREYMGRLAKAEKADSAKGGEEKEGRALAADAATEKLLASVARGREPSAAATSADGTGAADDTFAVDDSLVAKKKRRTDKSGSDTVTPKSKKSASAKSGKATPSKKGKATPSKKKGKK